MEPIIVEIPKYIRKVQFSAKQRPVYFEWDGLTIKGKKAKLHLKYFKDKTNIPKDVKIEHLKEHFYIGMFKNNKLNFVTRNTTELPSPIELVKTQNKYRLVIKQEDSFGENYTLLLCNIKVVNTPKFHLIRGQDFYNSKIREFSRGSIMDAIKECYHPYIVNLPVITEYPVKIECEVHDTIKNVYDNSNTPIGIRWDLDNMIYPYLKAFPDIMTKLGKLKDDDRLHLTTISTSFNPIENHDNRKLIFKISKDDRDIITSNKIYQDFHNPIKLGEGIENQIQKTVTLKSLTFKDLEDFGIHLKTTQEQQNKLNETKKIVDEDF